MAKGGCGVKDFIRVMKALSDPNRVKTMKMLEARELCVCEIAGVLGLAQSTVSKHLKILEDADLVESSKDGAWVNYRIAVHPANRYAAVTQSNLKDWLGDDPQIKKTIRQAEKADRIAICQPTEIGKIKK